MVKVQVEPIPIQYIFTGGVYSTEGIQDIKEKGMYEPITVEYLSEKRYRVIDGRRRYLASLLNNEKTIKAIVVPQTI